MFEESLVDYLEAIVVGACPSNRTMVTQYNPVGYLGVRA